MFTRSLFTREFAHVNLDQNSGGIYGYIENSSELIS